MNKKAALNLGISTVVVMVIAMVVIGAGVSFIRTFFGAGAGLVIDSMDIETIGLSPDRNSPFVLETRHIRMQPSNDAVTMRGAFYNQGETETVEIFLDECQPNGVSGSVQITDGEGLGIQTVAARVEQAESVGFQFILTTGANNNNNIESPQTYLCSLVIRREGCTSTSTGCPVLANQQITIEMRT